MLRRPVSLAEAAAAVAAGGWAHAGGIDVAQRLRDGEAAAEIVPVGGGSAAAGGLERLGEISLREGTLFIGAGVSHARIESDPLVNAHRPDLAAAWRTIGNVRIRAAGTLGGNLAAVRPGYDAAPILAAAGAEMIFAEPDGAEARCTVADLPRDRLIVGCEVPLAGRVVYDRSLKPVVSAAVGDHATAIGCAYAETQVIPHGASDPERLCAALAELPDPLDDAFASAAYRRRMTAVLAERCLTEHAMPPAPAAARPTARVAADTSDHAPAPSSAVPALQPEPDGEAAARVAHAHSQTGRRPTDDAAASPRPDMLAADGSSADVEMELNGEAFAVTAPVSEMLVDTIRTRAGLGGTRVGCDQAVCGACTVLIDGTPAASCSTFSWQAHDREICAIEGALGPGAADDVAGANDPDGADAATGLRSVIGVVQRAFAQTSAFQCGYCTPGLVLTASALLARDPSPDRDTICDWLDSNICRCTGYLMVIEAVEAAATDLGAGVQSQRPPEAAARNGGAS